MRRPKEPTFTHLVYECLVRSDDFYTAVQISQVLHVTSNRTGAALHHLRKMGAVASMESDGQLWWYATPTEDKRSRHIDERAAELKPRKPRKGKSNGQ